MADNYLNNSLTYKIKKILRYIKLFGPKLTLVKTRGQLHIFSKRIQSIDKSITSNKLKAPINSKHYCAIIGCGNFAYTTIAYYCTRHDKNSIRYAYDVNKNRTISLCKAYKTINPTDSIEEIIKDPTVKIVFVASNHASHADYARLLIKAGKCVHIEKPHVVNWQQLRELSEDMKNNPLSKVYLGFNRPKSEVFEYMDDHIKGENGTIMINWFIAGHDLPEDHWYFSEEEGGRILGNLCHWTDLTLRIVGFANAFPLEIIPGSKPETKSDFAVNYRFADGSLGVITFSAKGHSFEGVREWLSLHKGNAIVRMNDFHSVTIDVQDKLYKKKLLFRDYGHQANILNSLNLGPSVSREEIVLTAKLFLATRDAIESGRSLVIDGDTW